MVINISVSSFDGITSGWENANTFDEITDIIEHSATWVKLNGGYKALSEEQKEIVGKMIAKQIELGGYEQVFLSESK